MSFHHIRLNEEISYGSTFGPGFKTLINKFPGGGETRIQRWPSPLRKGNLKYGIRHDDNLKTVQEFYLGRRGSAFGWLFKDRRDFTTAPNWRDAPSETDVEIAQGDGATTQFQLTKIYDINGPLPLYRNLRKPVAGTVLAAIDGTPTTAFTVDTTTGIITFDSAPALNDPITIGCEFDVPVRFSGETDEWLEMSHVEFKASGADIFIEEIRDETATPDFYPYGNSRIYGNTTANVILNAFDKKLQVITPTASGVNVRFPDASLLYPGGEHFIIVNISASQSLTLQEFVSGSWTNFQTGSSVGAFRGRMCYIDEANRWRAV